MQMFEIENYIRRDMETRSAIRFPFVTEYARSGRSKCRKCETRIPEGDLRIAYRKMDWYGIGFLWHHFDCFWTTLEPERNREITEVLMLGIEDLELEDVERIREAIEIYNANRPSAEQELQDLANKEKEGKNESALGEPPPKKARFESESPIKCLVNDLLDQVEVVMQLDEAETLREIPLVANQEKNDFVAQHKCKQQEKKATQLDPVSVFEPLEVGL